MKINNFGNQSLFIIYRSKRSTSIEYEKKEEIKQVDILSPGRRHKRLKDNTINLYTKGKNNDEFKDVVIQVQPLSK